MISSKRTLISSFLCAALAVCCPAPAVAQKLTQVHIGVPTNTVTWFPLYVAWKKRIFQEQGIEMLPVTMSVRASLGALAVAAYLLHHAAGLIDDCDCQRPARQSDHDLRGALASRPRGET